MSSEAGDETVWDETNSVKVEEAAKLIGVTLQNVYAAMRKRKLAYVLRYGTLRVIPKAEVERYIKERQAREQRLKDERLDREARSAAWAAKRAAKRSVSVGADAE